MHILRIVCVRQDAYDTGLDTMQWLVLVGCVVFLAVAEGYYGWVLRVSIYLISTLNHMPVLDFIVFTVPSVQWWWGDPSIWPCILTPTRVCISSSPCSIRSMYLPCFTRLGVAVYVHGSSQAVLHIKRKLQRSENNLTHRNRCQLVLNLRAPLDTLSQYWKSAFHPNTYSNNMQVYIMLSLLGVVCLVILIRQLEVRYVFLFYLPPHIV